MKTSVKSAAVLIVAVVVGVVLGALTTSAVINSRMDRIRSLRTPGGFQERFEEIIGPMDPQQREAVMQILRETRGQLDDFRRSQMSEVALILDSTRARLEPLLTEEQLIRLRAILERERFRGPRRGPPGQSRGRRPPGPGSTPPPAGN